MWLKLLQMQRSSGRSKPASWFFAPGTIANVNKPQKPWFVAKNCTFQHCFSMHSRAITCIFSMKHTVRNRSRERAARTVRIHVVVRAGKIRFSKIFKNSGLQLKRSSLPAISVDSSRLPPVEFVMPTQIHGNGRRYQLVAERVPIITVPTVCIEMASGIDSVDQFHCIFAIVPSFEWTVESVVQICDQQCAQRNAQSPMIWNCNRMTWMNRF